QAEDGIRDYKVTGVQTCALPICAISEFVLQGLLIEPRRDLGELDDQLAAALRDRDARAVGEGVSGRGERLQTVEPSGKFKRHDRSEERRVGKEGRSLL